jgi:dienelactone hydrolase
VSLEDDLGSAAEAAAAFAGQNERIEAILAAEPGAGHRLYVCGYSGGAGRTWLVLDDAGHAVTDRALVREAVSLAALCEIAGEAADDEPPRLASPAYLDAVGSADALAAAYSAVESLTQEVEAAYKVDLS